MLQPTTLNLSTAKLMLLVGSPIVRFRVLDRPDRSFIGEGYMRRGWVVKSEVKVIVGVANLVFYRACRVLQYRPVAVNLY